MCTRRTALTLAGKGLGEERASCEVRLELVICVGHSRTHENMENKRMASGTVKWFNATKGYGFISPAGGGSDVFVHITAVQAAGLQGLNDGQQISYDLTEERGKTSAVNLKAG
jgi:cold shock protein